MHEIQEFVNYAEGNFNVLIIGTHGIGKTQICRDVAASLDYKFKTLSAPLMDPYVDFIGVPVPVTETITEVEDTLDGQTIKDVTVSRLNFARPRDLDDVEFLFIDELNRAHPKTLDGLFELLQFKSLNGRKLPKLKMVWAAINPPGSTYNVEELDPALKDRFHIYVNLEADPDVEVLNRKMSPEAAVALVRWWKEDLSNAQKREISPRRLEYIGQVHEKGLDIKMAIQPGSTLPLAALRQRLKGDHAVFSVIENGQLIQIRICTNDLWKRHELFCDQVVDENPDIWPKIIQCLLGSTWQPRTLFQMRRLWEKCPVDLLVKYFAQRKPRVIETIKKAYVDECGTVLAFKEQYPVAYMALNATSK